MAIGAPLGQNSFFCCTTCLSFFLAPDSHQAAHSTAGTRRKPLLRHLLGVKHAAAVESPESSYPYYCNVEKKRERRAANQRDKERDGPGSGLGGGSWRPSCRGGQRGRPAPAPELPRRAERRCELERPRHPGHPSSCKLARRSDCRQIQRLKIFWEPKRVHFFFFFFPISCVVVVVVIALRSLLCLSFSCSPNLTTCGGASAVLKCCWLC